MTAPAPSVLRIGTAERDAAIRALDEHLAAGRIDHEEYGERMAKASLARTRDELDELFRDLPPPHPFPAPSAPPPVTRPWGLPWAPVARRAWTPVRRVPWPLQIVAGILLAVLSIVFAVVALVAMLVTTAAFLVLRGGRCGPLRHRRWQF